MKKKVSILVLAAMIVSVALTSCNKNDEKEKQVKEFTVTFESNGGSAIQSQTVKEGGKVTKPSTDPIRSGYTFDAWYKDAALSAEWKFDTDIVTSAVTLYAKWIQNEVVYLLEEINGEDEGYEWFYLFEYDSQNRISKITDDELVNTISYNNNGEITVTDSDGDVTTFTKSGNKITIHYSWLDENKNNEELELNAQELLVKQTFNRIYDNGNWWTDTKTYEYQEKNMIKMTVSGEELWNGEKETYSYTGNLTYDDKKALFYHCKTPQWFIMWWYDFEFGVQNNIKSVITSEGATATFEYTYNDAGYPQTAQLVTQSPDEDEEEFIVNFIFKYRLGEIQTVERNMQEAQIRSNVDGASPKKGMNRKSFVKKLFDHQPVFDH